MADCTQKLQATISAAVESWQTGFNSLIVQHVRFFWADGCSTRCDLFNLVPSCPVSRCESPCTILMVSRCQVSRFQSPRMLYRMPDFQFRIENLYSRLPDPNYSIWKSPNFGVKFSYAHTLTEYIFGHIKYTSNMTLLQILYNYI